MEWMTPATTTQIEQPRPAEEHTLPECNCPHDCERDHETE
jgi:hypothetical protein